MKIDAQIIADSVSSSGVRLTTMKLTFHRYILAELNTHRMLSKNASSSRAIPTSKMIEMAIKNPAIPYPFTKNQKGMQSSEYIEEQEEAIKVWLSARDSAVEMVKKMQLLDVHKQQVNRLLEPYLWSTVIVTATEWNNFFSLRYHSMAQPEMCELAKKMWEVYSNNEPKKLQDGEWHLPFIANEELNEHSVQDLLKISTARCARVSYLNHEGKKPTKEEDLALHHRLVGSSPIHASPAEHQAMATSDPNVKSGNLTGWIQYRKTLKDENITEFKGPLE